MRALIAGMAVALMTSAAYAVDCGNAITVSSWELGEERDGRFPVTVTMASQMKAPTRMFEAFIVFEDALGAAFWSIDLDRDMATTPGEPFMVDRSLFAGQASGRLLTLAKEDVKVSTCVRAVVYADGSTERFPSQTEIRMQNRLRELEEEAKRFK